MLRIVALRAPGVQAAGLTIEDGTCVALMGPSGGGKSRLLRAIADLDLNEGEVRLDERERASFSGPEWRRQVVYLAADAGWWAERVEQHFADWPAVAAAVAALGLPGDAGGWPVSRLSTGERQRLALVRALARSPRVLLLDEPTSGLDPDATRAAEAVLGEARGRGMSLLWVTHDPEQASRVAERVRRVAGGRLLPESP